MTKHQETIKCPQCESEQVATVLHTIPFHSYVHFCDCGYIITESEWNKIEEKTNEEKNEDSNIGNIS